MNKKIPSRLALLLTSAACLHAGLAWSTVSVSLTLTGDRDAAGAEKKIAALLASPERETLPGPVVRYRAAAWSEGQDSSRRRRALDELKAVWGDALTVVEDGPASTSARAAAREPKVVSRLDPRSVQAALSVVPAALTAGRHKEAYDNDFDSGDPTDGGPATPPVTTPSPVAQGGLSKPPASGVDLAALDRTTPPCKDFFQYACGSWIKNNPIPPDQSRWGKFMGLRDLTLGRLKGLLENASRLGAAKAAIDADEKKLGDFYAACMDERAADARGAAPLADELARIDAVRDAAGLAAETARLHAVGVDALFSFGPQPDYEDANRTIAAVDQGGLGLPDMEMYADTDVVKSYSGHVARMFRLLGDDAATATREADAAVAVENELARISMTKTDQREPADVSHKTALADLQAQTPSFDWQAYLAAVGARKVGVVNVASQKFFKGLDAVIRRTPPAAWRSYLRWQLAHAKADALSSAFVDENFEFFGKELSGQKQIKPRWKRCVTLADGALGDALGREYVKAYFDGNTKTATLNMTRQIEDSMREDLQAISWMSPETRQKALQKLAQVTNRVGFPDRWRDYSALSVGSDAAANVDNARRFAFEREMAKIGQPTDRGEWGMTAPTVNAYYSPEMNSINFPAAILQPPFYDPNVDPAVNYGAIGSVEGHELTHGFDDQGRHFDGAGSLLEWWTKEDKDAFEKRAQGLIDQYSSFTTYVDPKDPKKNVNLNGRLTLGENTADNGGVRLAYRAYAKELQAHPGRELDGFTPQQRFFLGFAQLWCGSQTPASAKVMAVNDPHSPGQFRVKGVLSNMPEFAQAFSCQPGDGMVSATPARVW